MTLKVASVFSDNMVVQRGKASLVWGWDAPGARVDVRLGRKRAEATAGEDGRWQVTLPAFKAGGPFELVIHGTSERVFRNVVVGEVWVCSGQSNMQMQVSLAQNPEVEIPGADHPGIRLLTVPSVSAARPQAEFANAGWQVCDPERIRNFSAVAYFFGRELHQRLDVPVGLIQSAWGGTVAETWMSREGLLAEPAVKSIIDDFDGNLAHMTERRAEWQQTVKALERRTGDRENRGWAQGWADAPSPAGLWKDMSIPCLWQHAGLNFSGILWFRKEVDLPAAWAGQALRLTIGATDKSDTTYFNNTRVGGVSMQDREDAWSFQRSYAVSPELARAGRCVIAVRVHSDRFAGGMTGPASVMELACPTRPGDAPIPLAGVWRYAVEANYGLVQYPQPPLGPGEPNAPCALYNAMIAPLVPYAIRGAIWYQGESNAERARQYRALFPALIRDWRRVWGQGAFPFLFVQLANFKPARTEPGESQWAELREAQAMALDLPRTGMAVAIDIGDGGDVHPANKQEVGRRLAVNALAKVYRLADVVPDGPRFRSVRREGETLRLRFRDTAGGLVCRGDTLTGFAVAGRDGRFAWAEARLDGECVVVSSPSVPRPVAVRYGWADNPACNLYNTAGLPAVPFRTDEP